MRHSVGTANDSGAWKEMQPYVCEKCGVIRDIIDKYDAKGRKNVQRCPVCGSTDGRYLAITLHYEERPYD